MESMLTTLNDLDTVDNHIFNMVDNYIYFYHLNRYIVLPTYADNLSDSTQISYSQTTPLGRTAPIFSYSNSGPRTIQFSFDLHRDLMTQINQDVDNYIVQNALSYDNSIDDDYVDILIKYLQAAALPTYNSASKAISPPIIAVRMGDDIFIKGVLSSSVGITYNLPILRTGKYASLQVSFGITEINPYSADEVISIGSYRLADNLDRGLSSSLYQID